MPAARAGTSLRGPGSPRCGGAPSGAGCRTRRRRTPRNRPRRRRPARRRRRAPRAARPIRGAQQAVDGERLAADLGGDPARDHRDEARRPHHQRGRAAARLRRAVPRSACEQAAEAEPEHRKPRPTMMRNDPEDDGTGGQSFARDGVQARPAARPGDASGSATTAWESRSHTRTVGLGLVGQPNRISGAPSGWLWKWPSIAMILAG